MAFLGRQGPLWKSCLVAFLALHLVESRSHSQLAAFCGPASGKALQVPSLSKRTPPSPPRVTPTINLGKGNDNGDQEDPDDAQGEKTDDKWISALKQWPLHPATAADSSDTGTDSRGKKGVSSPTDIVGRPRTDFLSPLARLIDVEALLQAGEVESSPSSPETLDIWKALEQVSSLGEYKYNASFVPADNGTPATTDSAKVSALQRLESLNGWDQWIGTLRKNVFDMAASADSAVMAASAESILKQATLRIETLVADASAAVSPKTIETLIVKASQALRSTTAANDLVEVARQMALDRGLDVGEAAELARETTAYAAKLATVADSVLRQGYVEGDLLPEKQTLMDGVPAVVGSRALFANFDTASEINTAGPVLSKAAEMSALSGALYEDTVAPTLELGHTVVAQGVSDDVVWMVTDSIADATAFGDRKLETNSAQQGGPVFVRTITIRGFDASDEGVDREQLLNRICDATPEQIKADQVVFVHSGLMGIARSIYKDTKQYVDWMAPNHRLVLNGHSIGGCLSQLLLILMTTDRGVEFVRERVLRVYTFGSPPVMQLQKNPKESRVDTFDRCDILDAFDLPSSMVHGYVQPWDPIVRLFSRIDALYPLVGDLGQDGVTPYVSGPPRTLRPITKAIIEAWDGWPRFRDTFRDTLVLQNYTTVGIQHVLLPEPTRYLGDRFVSVNIAVPPVETLLRISPAQLHPALEEVFPLDVFEISFVPQAIRSFVHHFYPAYGIPLPAYVKRLELTAKGLPLESLETQIEPVLVPVNGAKAGPGSSWDLATQWLQGKERASR